MNRSSFTRFDPRAADAEIWRTTANGKHFELDTETGEITRGNIGQGEWDSPSRQNSRRDKVEDAMLEIANGKPEATVSGLRNDLEQYGGTNDVTIIRGDSKKGLIHIAKRHGEKAVAPVLEAVANGKIYRFEPKNKTIALRKDGYEAILSLEEHGKQKTWLLTGYDLFPDKKGKTAKDERGKLSQDTRLRIAGPSRSRPGMGALAAFAESITCLMAQVNTDATDGPKEIIVDEVTLIAAIRADILQSFRQERRASAAQDAMPEPRALSFTGSFAGLKRIALPDREPLS